jgi:hypothetical protein
MKKFEDAKGAIRNRKSKKDRQYNCQKKTNKGTSNEPQNTTQIEQHESHQTQILRKGKQILLHLCLFFLVLLT